MFTDGYETVDWIQQLVNLIKPQKRQKDLGLKEQSPVKKNGIQ